MSYWLIPSTPKGDWGFEAFFMGERIMNVNKMAENVKELKSQESKNWQVHLLLVSLIKLLRREK